MEQLCLSENDSDEECWEKLKTDKMDRHTHTRSFKVARTHDHHSFGQWLHRHLPVTCSNYLYRT